MLTSIFRTLGVKIVVWKGREIVSKRKRGKELIMRNTNTYDTQRADSFKRNLFSFTDEFNLKMRKDSQTERGRKRKESEREGRERE